MDTVNTPTIPKKLRRLSAQDPGESRRRWHLVTEALKKRDMEAASDAKHLVRNLIMLTGIRAWCCYPQFENLLLLPPSLQLRTLHYYPQFEDLIHEQPSRIGVI